MRGVVNIWEMAFAASRGPVHLHTAMRSLSVWSCSLCLQVTPAPDWFPAPQGYAWFFLGYEATVSYFLQNAGPGVHSKADLNYLQVMAAGVVAGFGLWGSMFPIDTIKSKMQVRASRRLAPRRRD